MPVVECVTDPAEREHCFALRRLVFMDEQKVSREEEFDGLDDVCEHFLVKEGDTPVATARLRLVEGNIGKAERVAVRLEARGQGMGRLVMRALEGRAQEKGAVAVLLGAQVTAIPFYERLGYAVEGELFVDAGIDHRWMRKHL